MARKNFIILFVLLLVIAIPNIEAGEDVPKTIEKKIDIVVEAMVYCQSCEHFGTRSLTGAKPVPSAKVSVTCENHKAQPSYYKVFETDKKGYVYAALEGFKMQHYILDHPLQSCYVKLVWSPLESCNLLSNVNYDLNGAPLRYENRRLHGSNYEAVFYAAGPLAFRPSDCSNNTTHN
ncbi:non-classical arabinogalactan protein 30-like [Gastrolobium bilobum]|uniref:non-classical arabinogalactan protein 30-like n=1 Tax=Gastrolobium bilobum TaxID=150636 RepID=UPI002AAFD3EE|nr:non-classical arabinogalactan protein 30-like [Gastrolobium bilobum]